MSSRTVQIHPSEAIPAVAEGASLAALIQALQSADAKAPKDPASGFKTAKVYGLRDLRVTATETMSVDQVKAANRALVLKTLAERAQDHDKPGLSHDQLVKALAALDRTELVTPGDL